jgi:hypothetical protein
MNEENFEVGMKKSEWDKINNNALGRSSLAPFPTPRNSHKSLGFGEAIKRNFGTKALE